MAAERHNDVWGEEAPETATAVRPPSAESVLAAAVLRLAYEDLMKHRRANDVRQRRAFREAYAWVTSDERRWPFSFVNVCEMLDMSPEALRAKMLSNS